MNAPNSSFTKRLKDGQGGNVIAYLVVFAVLWFAFFTIKGCIKEAKESRLTPRDRARIESRDSTGGEDDGYSNPYMQ